jgi:hypothetical protein
MPARRFPDHAEQRRLADSGLADDKQHGTMSGLRAGADRQSC